MFHAIYKFVMFSYDLVKSCNICQLQKKSLESNAVQHDIRQNSDPLVSSHSELILNIYLTERW
jgi:hypothetical protein